jgi:hypothetical protein
MTKRLSSFALHHDSICQSTESNRRARPVHSIRVRQIIAREKGIVVFFRRTAKIKN